MDMKSTVSMNIVVCVITLLELSFIHVGDTSSLEDLTDSFTKYVDSLNLDAYTYGIIAEDELVAAEGQGQIRDHTAHAGTLLPVLGVSKLFTAVAVIQLIEEGDLHMEDTIFGNNGILYYIRPEHANYMDPRLRDITVRDLLYHTAGWDETKGPIYDPMLNAYYVRNGYNVLDISREMDVYGILSYDDIIRFMVTQPLHYSPGTKRVESNFGYSVLGRVIEEVTDTAYEDYVKDNILRPYGMWHTRMGPSYSNTLQAQSKDSVEPGRPPKMGFIPLDASQTKSLFDIVPPIVLDACLGWHSNIYDLSRFFVALFLDINPDNRLLSLTSVDRMILDPAVISDNDYTELDGINIANNYQGDIWFKSFHPDIRVQVAFFHKTAPFWNDALVNTIKIDVSILLISLTPVDQPEIIENLVDWCEESNLASLPYVDSIIDEDLANIVMSTQSKDYMLIEDLDEHHLLAYMDAIRLADYVPIWLHAYKFHGRTNFIVISEQAEGEQDLDYVILERTDREELITDIADELKDNYQLCFLHSFNSAAHDNGITHLAMLKGQSDQLSVEFDIGCDLASYSQHVREGFGSGYLPMVQSVDVQKSEFAISYILKQNPSGTTHFDDSISALDLNLEDLKQALHEHSKHGYILDYLDTFTAHGESRFSALFRKKLSGEVWILSTDVKGEDLTKEVMKWEELSYIPRIMVGYSDNHQLRFAIFFKGAK